MAKDPANGPLKRTWSPKHRFLVIAIVLVTAVLGVCATAYYFYQSSREAYLTERSLRLLGEQSRALTAVIANYENVFQSILDGVPQKTKNGVDLLCLEDANTLRGDRRKQAIGAALCELGTLTRVVLDDNPGEAKKKAGFAVTFGGRSKEAVVVLNYTGKARESSVWNIRGEIPIAKLLEQLRSEEIFGETILSDEEGRVIYEDWSNQNAIPLQFLSLNVLFQGSGKPNSEKSSNEKGANEQGKTLEILSRLPTVDQFKVGQITYKFFAQAGTLPTRTHGKVEKSQFVLVGLISADKFNADARAIPVNLLLVLVSTVLLVFLGLPYIKLIAMDEKDRLSMTDVLALLLVSLLGIGLFTLGLADLLIYQRTEDRFDRALKAAAGDLKMNFRKDLADARELIQRFDDYLGSCEQTRITKDSPWQASLAVTDGAITIVGAHDHSCKQTKGPARSDLDVNQMFWVWPDGHIHVDWASQGKALAPQISLRDRHYVKRIWQHSALGTDRSQFWIQPVYSLTTGKNYAIVSMLSKVRASLSTDGPQTVVAALETKMPSVMDPVVLPGFGFAVIEQSGKVLFHSDSRRNLRENFFEETDKNSRLWSLVLTRSEDFVDGKYWGGDRRFHVSPIHPEINRPDMSWSLIVYRDKDLLRTMNLHALSLAAFLFGIYSIVILAIGLFGMLIYPALKNEQRGWIWPSPSRVRDYQSVIVLNFIFVILFGGLFFTFEISVDHPETYMLFLTFVFQFLLLLTLMWFYHSGIRIPEIRLLNHRTSYLLMAMTFLLLYAVVPAFSFSKLAFDAEMKLLVKFTQFDLVQDLQRSAPNADTKACRKDLPNVYANFLFDKNIDCGDPQTMNQKGGETTLFDRFHALFRVPLNTPVSRETDGFIETGSPDQPWRWEVALPETFLENRKLTLFEKGDGNDLRLRITSLIPGLNWWFYWLLIFGALMFWLLGCGIVWLMEKFGEKKVVVKIMVSLALLLLVAGGLLLKPQATLILTTGLIGVGVFSWLLYALPRFVANRVFLLNAQVRVTGNASADLWQSCSDSEKLALFHVARDGFLNASNPALAPLLEKRLLVLDPDLRLMNDDCRNRILVKEEEFAAWKSQGKDSTWNRVWLPVGIALLGVAVFLIATQDEYRAITLGLIPVLSAVFGLVQQLFSRADKKSEPASE